MGFFCTKYSMFELKKYKRVFLMTLKNDAIFEEKLTCGLQNAMSNLAKFYQSTRKSIN